jgi:hypothetical protein
VQAGSRVPVSVRDEPRRSGLPDRPSGVEAAAIKPRNCRRRRGLEQSIIVPRRNNSAHLHRPWRAILRYHARLFSAGARVPHQAAESRMWV